MSALLDSIASGFDSDASRQAALDVIVRDGLPGPRSEAWKYTSLRALERRVFAPATQPTAPLDAGVIVDVPAPRLVLVNGYFDALLSDISGLGDGVQLLPLSQTRSSGASVLADDDAADHVEHPNVTPADDVFARLNNALAREGVVLRIGEGIHLERPIHVVHVGAPADGTATGSDLAWHNRHRIELAGGASATIVEHCLAAGAHAHLGTTLTQVRLADDARLIHARVQDESPTATLFARTDALLAGGSEYIRVDLELGAALSRHELNVRLAGEGARLSAGGVLLASGRRHLDTRLGIEHLARDTDCTLLWRGLGAGRGRAVFHGGITIHAGADGSSANLSNKNLLLSNNAEIDTQPVLEIHADEVKAAHGATVGQLDPTALFYLRSRGLSEHDARRLLTTAFCRETVAAIADPALRALLDARVDHALAREALVQGVDA